MHLLAAKDISLNSSTAFEAVHLLSDVYQNIFQLRVWIKRSTLYVHVDDPAVYQG